MYSPLIDGWLWRQLSHRIRCIKNLSYLVQLVDFHTGSVNMAAAFRRGMNGKISAIVSVG